MNLLEAAIATALALAALATMCTLVVELVHRMLRLRSAGLRQMLEAYFDAEILPRIRNSQRAHASPEPISVDTLRADMVDTLVRNPLHRRLSRPDGALGGFFAWLYRPLRDYTVVRTEDFLRRLPDSQCFGALATGTEADRQTLIRELEARYDNFGAAISDYFKRRAQLLSMVCGVVLAVAANINGVRMFDVFVRDAELRGRMIAQADDIERRIDEAQKTLAPSAGPSELSAIRADFEKLDRRVGELEGIGLPIGWRYYPNCLQEDSEAAPACRVAVDAGASCPKAGACMLTDSILNTAARDPRGFVSWLFAVLLTGVLIGLGGPFWFDVAMRLSRVREALTGKGSPQQGARQDQAQGESESGAQDERRALREAAASQLAPVPRKPTQQAPGPDQQE